MADRLLCGNAMHESRTAVARVSFPAAQFANTTSCRECVRWHLETALDFGHPVLIEPVTAEDQADG